MGSDKQHILKIQRLIRERHNVESEHIRSVPVSERVKDKHAWKGMVEVFRLQGHPKTTRCFAWTTEGGEIITMLGIPPVFGPASAVQVAFDRWPDGEAVKS